MWRLLLLLFVSFSVTTVGQTVIEQVFQESDHIAFNKVFLSSNGHWIMPGSANPDGSVSPSMYFVRATDGSGAENWIYNHWFATDEKEFLYSAAPRIGSVGITNAGKTIISAFPEYCDVPSSYTVLSVLDSTGSLVCEKWLEDGSIWGNGYGYLTIADNIDDVIAVASVDTILILESDSIISQRWECPSNPIHCLRWESDSTLLVNAGFKTLRFHENGSLLDSVSLTQSDSGIDIRTRNGEIWVLTNNSIQIFTQQLQLITSIDLSSFSGSRFDLVDVLGEVWFTDGNVLARVDEQFNITNVIEFDFPNCSVAVRDSLVMTASTVVQNDKNAGMMKSYELDGTSISNDHDDVELLVNVNSTYATVFSQNVSGYVNCEIRLINHSDNTLNEILVSAATSPPYAVCGTPAISVRYENLNLLQDDTAVFQFPPILVYTGWTQAPPDSAVRTVCLTAQSPNNHLDNNPGDNVACATASILLDTKESEPKRDLNVYPNPTTGIVNLPQIENLKWQLFDATGRLVVNGNGIKQINLQQFGLTPSIYFLQLTVDEKTTTSRITFVKH